MCKSGCVVPPISPIQEKKADVVHHRHPCPRGQVSSALTWQEVPGSGKVSTGQSDRWPGGGPPEGESGQVPAPARLKVTISGWRIQGLKLLPKDEVYQY